MTEAKRVEFPDDLPYFPGAVLHQVIRDPRNGRIVGAIWDDVYLEGETLGEFVKRIQEKP